MISPLGEAHPKTHKKFEKKVVELGEFISSMSDDPRERLTLAMSAATLLVYRFAPNNEEDVRRLCEHMNAVILEHMHAVKNRSNR